MQDILLATTVQLKSNGGRAGKILFFCGVQLTHEVWNCCSHFAANGIVFFLSFQTVGFLFPLLVLLQELKLPVMLNTSDDSRYSCLLPDFKRKGSNSPPLSMMIAIGDFIDPFGQTEVITLYSKFAERLYS